MDELIKLLEKSGVRIKNIRLDGSQCDQKGLSSKELNYDELYTLEVEFEVEYRQPKPRSIKIKDLLSLANKGN